MQFQQDVLLSGIESRSRRSAKERVAALDQDLFGFMVSGTSSALSGLASKPATAWAAATFAYTLVRILARKMTREVRHAACASKLVIAYDGDSETRLLPEAVKIVIVCVYVCKGPTRILPNFGKTLWRYTRTCFSSNACRQQFYVKAHDPDRIMYFY